jgi:predicted transposase YbfD/YdcC
MNQSSPLSLRDHFESVDDPRVERTKEYALLDIIVIAICAVICGADDWVDIAGWGTEKIEFLRQFMPLENGIPSHDTFGRVFSRLDGVQFQAAFLRWVQSAFEVSEGQVVAIDGKQMRRSHDRQVGKAAIYMVSAWASLNHLTLGQRKVDDKSNEITAIPELLKVLALQGCIVTIDAMGCQKEIATTILDQQADYVLALKENQEHLYQDTVDLFRHIEQTPTHGLNTDYVRTVEKDHGRVEIRECWTISDPQFFPYFRTSQDWPQLQTLIKVRRERRLGDKTTVETHFYIASLLGSALLLLNAIRAHWGIENSLHWVLDVAFREDDQRARVGNSPQNFAVLRHIALNLLKHEPSLKVGIKAKRLRAAWSESYLLKILSI